MPFYVTIDQDRIAHVDGKRFFLIGARHMPEGGTPQLLKEVGFNAYRILAFGHDVSAPDPLPEPDSGIMFWSYLYDRLVLGRKPEYRKELLCHIREVRRHPAFLCYENYNEIAWAWKNGPCKAQPEELQEGLALLRTEDPDHPIWLAHACNRTAEALARYNSCLDILGCNPYPVQPGQLRHHIGFRPDGYLLDCPDRTIHAVGRYTEKMMRVGNGRTPVWMLVQALANENWFNPLHTPEYAGETIDSSKVLYPTLAQMRFMVYDAIASGATGIALSMYRTPTTGAIWEDIKSLVKELRSLHDALCAQPVLGEIQVTYTDLGFSIWDGVRTLARRLGDYVYLFAVNTAFDPAEAAIRLPINVKNVAQVRGQDRELAVKNNVLRDRFEPYAVHVYQLRTQS